MADKKGAKEEKDTKAYYIELSKLEKNGDFEKALKVCNKILNIDPKDETAFHCRMVCLMQLGKFGDALKQIRDTHFKVDLTFEESYCLYRLNKPEEALAIIEESGKKSEKIRELQAQIYYRMEMYQEAYDLYRDIMKNTNDDFEKERLTNLQATAVYVEGAQVMDQDETYEMCYNRGCQLLGEQKWSQAEDALKKAEEMCKTDMKEDEADDEEIERETGIIRVQIGFAVQMQGYRDREAQNIYNSVLKTKPSDIGLVAVASNNLVTLNKDQNIFDSKKRIKAASAEGVEHKLTTSNRATIARNNALLAMYTNQVELCKTLVSEVAKAFPDSYDDQDRTLITAGVLARSGKVQDSVDLLLENSTNDLDRTLIATQVLLEKGQVPNAIAILEKLPQVTKHRTGILSMLVSLYLANDQRAKAATLLKNAMESGKSSKNKDMNLVYRKTAEFHLKGDEPSVAAKSLEELLKSNPKDKTTLAQLVLAYAKFDLKKAMEISKKLPDFVSKSVDVDALESSATMSRYGKKATIGSPKPQTPEQVSEETKKKRRKKRKKRLPKSFNPNVDPDPERWVPRRERTGYRRTRKERRKGEKFTGAQGTAAGQAEAFDYSKKQGQQGAIPKSPQVQEMPQGPRQQQRKPQAKGKKKSKKHF